MTSNLYRRSQLSAVAELRWRMFVNSLRSRRGKVELASRIVVGLAFTFAGLGGAAGLMFGAYFFVANQKAQDLTVLLWPIFFFWQLFPLMATAFTSNPDSSDLLRFPVTYRSYFIIRLAYGFFDPATALGSLWVFAILLGVTVAQPLLFPWAALTLLTFALFNLVLMQTMFAWVERWLAQRRTREILGVVFILLMLSFQLIGPMIERLGRGPRPALRHSFEIAAQVQRAFPPGLAADSIADASSADFLSAVSTLLLLAGLTTAFAYLLHLRLRRQFRGENLSESAARPTVSRTQGLQVGWDVPGVSPSVAAVFEKEMRYLGRSGPMLLTLIMPIFMLLVFRMGAMNPMRHSSFLSRAPDIAFPGAAAYALLVLTNLIYNSFGGDSGGIQFFYASPARFSQIVLGKNLTHAVILLCTTMLAWITVAYFYGRPAPAVSVATLTGLLFAAPLNFGAGNLLSVYSPKKRDFATFGRQNVSQTTVLVSLGVQIVIVGAGVAAFALARLYQNLWIAALIFLALSAISFPFYIAVLKRLDAIAIERRETLIGELCRA